MQRRDFLKFGLTGLATVAVGSMSGWPSFLNASRAFASTAGRAHLHLDMVEADAEMVDGVQVPMWAFKLAGSDHSHPAGGARIPGPAIVALEGERIHLTLSNHIRQGGAHGFAIPGVPLTANGQLLTHVTVPEDEEPIEIMFTAPAAGTYMYFDPLNAPVNRVMGLHGALVVLPNPVVNNTPYSGLSSGSAIQRLFDDLGTTAHFPGNPWDPTRNAVWILNTIDPEKAEAATDDDDPLAPQSFLNGFLPQYFTLNGKSGFFSAQHSHGDPDEGGDHSHAFGENQLPLTERLFDVQGNVSIRGTVGQPIVIRSLNAGLMWHSPHIHGNHVYTLTHSNALAGSRAILDNLTMVDTWTLAPGDIKDVLLPFIQPPDIPQAVWPPQQELFPLVYPMHDHNEISNTAAGGNYPQGMATHWQIDGPFDPADPATAVITITRADLRVRTGQLILEGRCTVPNIHLDVHGGSGQVINNRIQVDANGRFEFRGRALKALASRFITMMHHDENDSAVVHAIRSVPLRLR